MTMHPDRKLHLVVVGVGARAGLVQHALASGRADAVAFVDPSQSGRQRGRALFGPHARAFHDLEEFLASGPLADAAFVTSPDDTHNRIAISLLDAGIPVYLEKPIAITTEGADAVLRAARRTGVPLYLGHNMRHMAFVTAMRTIIRRGEIGRVQAIWCRHFVGNGGDYYFKDWHADRSKSTGLLLQKGAHDIDVIHWLAGGYASLVSGMGALQVYGKITDRGGQGERTMPEWFDMGNWPPAAQRGLNPVVDVEDLSMVHMRLDNGVLASYEQCHFTPDYWRNYTVIGTEGRLENFGDSSDAVIRVWNKRHTYQCRGDVEYPVTALGPGHDDADRRTVTEFLDYITVGALPVTSPLAARYAVAAGCAATESLRHGCVPVRVPPFRAEIDSTLPGQATDASRNDE